jgi:hypothetical protein
LNRSDVDLLETEGPCLLTLSMLLTRRHRSMLVNGLGPTPLAQDPTQPDGAHAKPEADT